MHFKEINYFFQKRFESFFFSKKNINKRCFTIKVGKIFLLCRLKPHLKYQIKLHTLNEKKWLGNCYFKSFVSTYLNRLPVRPNILSSFEYFVFFCRVEIILRDYRRIILTDNGLIIIATQYYLPNLNLNHQSLKLKKNITFPWKISKL